MTFKPDPANNPNEALCDDLDACGAARRLVVGYVHKGSLAEYKAGLD